ncbi:hypothetical protein CMQ_185 [Grosmannia clavigera kw1407]|uniref:Uncharacterized protein n=1 Tax=Grosmannia clavigera (strain kw1407 / UAMH 11150) TaxID=655863 RepID=F0XRA7_GROCL|nr:uncharacterized protein CMQ_185 [Grosmannia clavigera kw1407]EFW99867.1 hypothetical protein CMQ_185 [Grosmannia clavigera kw1407]
MEAVIPSYACKINGRDLKKAANKRVDSPITPPFRDGQEMESLLSAISERASPFPFDEESNAGKHRLADYSQKSPAKPIAPDEAAKTPSDDTGDKVEVSKTQQTVAPSDTKEGSSTGVTPDAENNGPAEKGDHGEKNGNKPEPPLPSNIPARPPSTKSRNASLSRADGRTPIGGHSRSSSLSRMSIPIAASPSLFYREPFHKLWHSESPIYVPPGGVTKEDQPTRPESGKEMVEIRSRNPSITRPLFACMAAGPSNSHPLEFSSRSVSRGRQPLAKAKATEGDVAALVNTRTSRATGSADRGRQASNNRSIVSRGAISTTSSASWLFETPPLRTQPGLDPDDEIIAMISLISRSCPVHNHSQVQTQAQGNQPGGSTTTATSNAGELAPHIPVVGGAEDSIYEVFLPPNIRELVNSLPSSDSRNQATLRGLELARNRESPKFDPPTPTAMQYDVSLKDEKNIRRVSSV